MTDIVEELWASDDASALTNRAAREIDRLQQEVTRVEGQRNASNRHIEKLSDQLYASQAHIEKLREALTQAHSAIVYKGKSVSMTDAMLAVSQALALPHDDSALKERLAQERERHEGWRDAVAFYVQDHCVDGEAHAETIRAMGDKETT